MVMDYKDLIEKYHKLLVENKTLKEENESLKARLGLNQKSESDQDQGNVSNLPFELDTQESPSEIHGQNRIEQGVAIPCSILTNSAEKISLFMSLFKGRDDVYAKRWQSKDSRSGYTPVCLNEWKSILCRKPKVKCFNCRHKSYDVLN
jgi:hypothetical protein